MLTTTKVSNRLFVTLALTVFAFCAQGQEKPVVSGFGQFYLAPPHNEIDPGICGLSTANDSSCTAFARYMATVHLDIAPFGKIPVVNRLYLFGNGNALFGNNVPQKIYTWSSDPIGWERDWGAAYTLPKRFEVRVEQHFLFGQFRDFSQSSVYKGTNGPWGRFNVVGVRKYFSIGHANQIAR
jgi:hypothetical protein